MNYFLYLVPRSSLMADRRFYYLLHRAQHSLQKFTDHQLAERLDISSAQLGALFYLRKNDGCLLKELSKGLGLNNSAITGLIGRMEVQGLAARQPCERDGRASRVFMTPLGREKAEAGFGPLAEMNAVLEEGFTEAELDAASRFLESIIERMGRKSRIASPSPETETKKETVP